MKFTLNGCEHGVAVYTWTGQERGDGFVHGTCVTCYQRVRILRHLYNGFRSLNWIADLPAAVCMHGTKIPIAEEITRKLPYKDAVCDRCGVVLRHPDGPGEWAEVIFNGYLIREEPF